jgi:hypothetical protein
MDELLRWREPYGESERIVNDWDSVNEALDVQRVRRVAGLDGSKAQNCCE